MTTGLSIDANWETLDRGSPEERACFSAIGIRFGDIWLSEADDRFVNRVRERPHLSGYHLAEWLAWSWWRHRWEPQSTTVDWSLAHKMSSIGGGYLWPNITTFSDGERVVLIAKPTQPRPSEPLRYIADFVAVVRAGSFESAIDNFIVQIVDQLGSKKVEQTNLHRIWSDVSEERLDHDASMRRRFEAMLGYDPDEAKEQTIEQLVGEAQRFGEEAVRELAAHSGRTGTLITSVELERLASSSGLEARAQDAVSLARTRSLSPIGQVPAWKRGAEAADAIRDQERLGDAPIDNSTLTTLAGVQRDAIERRPSERLDLSFAWDVKGGSRRVVLRSKWPTGRRFEVGRLLGDQLAIPAGGSLRPATRAYTYRQKMQRSFAAELLCPTRAALDLLKGDFTSDAIEDVADHFMVSERTVRTLLVNHGYLEREDLGGGEVEPATRPEAA